MKQHLVRHRYKNQPLEEILVENSSYGNTSRLKKKLFEAGLLKNECCLCGQLPTWNGQPLVLQLDHINGVSNDNRLINLRILCPNCHSQTATYAGKHKGAGKDKKKYSCSDCATEITKQSKSGKCKRCSQKHASVV